MLCSCCARSQHGTSNGTCTRAPMDQECVCPWSCVHWPGTTCRSTTSIGTYRDTEWCIQECIPLPQDSVQRYCRTCAASCASRDDPCRTHPVNRHVVPLALTILLEVPPYLHYDPVPLMASCLSIQYPPYHR